MQLTPAVVILGAAAVMAFGVRPVLDRLPEPAEGDGKPLYRELGTTRFVAITSALAALGVAISWLSLGREVQPLWWVLAVFGVLLAAIDARTTWLPLLLTRFAWLAMAVATLTAAALAADWWLLPRSIGGAAAAGGLYLIVWFAARGGFGFGDVRFAPLIGAATAAHSATPAGLGAAPRQPGRWLARHLPVAGAPTGQLRVRARDAVRRLRRLRHRVAELTGACCST